MLRIQNKAHFDKVKAHAETVGLADNLQKNLDRLEAIAKNTGGECHLGYDFAPYSLSFAIVRGGDVVLNGGLIVSFRQACEATSSPWLRQACMGTPGDGAARLVVSAAPEPSLGAELGQTALSAGESTLGQLRSRSSRFSRLRADPDIQARNGFVPHGARCAAQVRLLRLTL